jgi:sodium/potassium-transporting ATPase subunit alpha
VEHTNENYLETHNIGMQGTYCAAGSGLGIVVAIGDRTVFGRIARLTNKPTPGMSTLQKEIFRFVVIICSLMVTANILVILLW